MATETQDGLNYIIQAINNIVEPKVASLKYDKTYRAKVTEIVDEGVYKVKINNVEYQLSYGGNLSVGDIVKVKAPLNNFSDIYIEALPGSGGGGGGTDNYNDLTNKPILNTNITTAQSPNANEIIKGTISLHKISKTGNYNDLNNKPSLDFIPNSQKGVAGGVATLDDNGRVFVSQLPEDTVFDNNYTHTDNNFTTVLKNKLDGIEEGAEVNKINAISQNGTILEITDKTVNITTPTKTSELENDGEDGTHKYVSDNDIATYSKLGLIKVGDNLTISSDGTLSATGGTTVGGDTLPIGSVVEWYSDNIPGNWLLCNGQEVSREEYAELFAILGTTYGEGDGSSTFNLPNLESKVPVGKNNNDTDFDTLGKTGGTKSNVLTINNLPEHSHTYDKVKSTTESHILTVSQIPRHAHRVFIWNANNSNYTAQRIKDDGTGYQTATTGARAPTSGFIWQTSSFKTAGNEIFSGCGDPSGNTSFVGSGEGHSHDISTENSNTGKIGTGESVNNLQPYIVTNYIIKARQTVPITALVIDNLTSTSSTDALSANQGRILSGRVTANTTNISNNAQEIINIKAKNDEQDGNISDISDEIDSINFDISNIKNQQKVQSENIATLTEEVGENTTNIATNTQDISDIKTKNTEQDTAISNINSNISDINTSIQNLTNNKLEASNIKAGTNITIDKLGNDCTINAIVPTETSQLINNGSDGTSTYVEEKDLGTAAKKNVGTAEGEIPVLDSNGKLSESVIPATAITDVFVVNSEASMLALDAQKGDIAVRTDLNKTFILKDIPASSLDNWVEMLTPTDMVLSVNTKTGNVVLTSDDINVGSTTDTITQKLQELENAISGAGKRYTEIIGNGNDTSFIVTHGLNSDNCIIQVSEANSPYAVVIPDIELTSMNSCTIKFRTAPTENQFKVNIIG